MKTKLLLLAVAVIAGTAFVAGPSALATPVSVETEAVIGPVPPGDSINYLLCCEPPPANICAPQDGDWTPFVYVLGRSFPYEWYYHSGDRVIMYYGTYSAQFTCVWNNYPRDVRWRLDYYWHN
jgi:hypothetical protein